MPKNKPNFFIVGAPKAGTTALYRQLQLHPDVFMPDIKEPSFFSKKEKVGGDGIKNLTEYESLFAKVDSESAIGEASVNYLHSKQAPLALKSYCPEAKIIVILRQPVLRAYSHYRMLLNQGVDKYKTFQEASRSATRHIQNDTAIPYGTGYRQSFYAESIHRYIEYFSNQILVLEHRTYRQNPKDTFKKILSFLGVESSFSPSTIKREYNKGSGIPKSLFLQKLIYSQSGLKAIWRSLVPDQLRHSIKSWILRSNQSKKNQLLRDEVQQYTKVFHDDIRQTEVLTGLDLSEWRTLPYLPTEREG